MSTNLWRALYNSTSYEKVRWYEEMKHMKKLIAALVEENMDDPSKFKSITTNDGS